MSNLVAEAQKDHWGPGTQMSQPGKKGDEQLQKFTNMDEPSHGGTPIPGLANEFAFQSTHPTLLQMFFSSEAERCDHVSISLW